MLNLSYFMIFHIFKDKHKVCVCGGGGGINSVNLLILLF